MRYSERLSLVLIREDGRRRSWRLRRIWLHALLASLLLLPCLVGGLGWLCHDIWRENSLLQREVLRLEGESETMEARLERLDQLSVLLEESAVPGREILTRALAQSEGDAVSLATREAPPVSVPDGEDAAIKERMAKEEGPGHADFPAVRSEYVSVDKVQVRLAHNRTLRVALDLRNKSADRAKGEVVAVLVMPDGRHVPLNFLPADIGKFSILRFKHAVISASVPKGMERALSGAQVMLEVRGGTDNAVVFRNIFAVEQ